VRVGTAGFEQPPELSLTRGHRWTVYQNLLTILRLHDEASYESGAAQPESVAARAAVLRLVGDAQGLLLALLTLVRHRLDVDLHEVPEAARRELHLVGAGVAETIAAAADRVDGRSAPFPDCRALLARAEQALAAPALAPLDAPLRTHL